MISQVGTKGMFACIVGLFDDAKTPCSLSTDCDQFAVQRFAENARMLLRTVSRAVEEAKGFEGLGVKYRSAPKPGEYRWKRRVVATVIQKHLTFGKDSKHFHATDSIIQPKQRARCDCTAL